jgi:predicted component of type VI protein secretion system
MVKSFGEQGVSAYPIIEQQWLHLFERITRLQEGTDVEIKTFSRLPKPVDKTTLERLRKVILKLIIEGYENQAYIIESSEIGKLLYRQSKAYTDTNDGISKFERVRSKYLELLKSKLREV